MPRRNGERVGRSADRSPEAGDRSVAKVIRADVSRIVHLIVGDAFDVGWTAECRVNCHAVATRRAAGVSEIEGLVIVGSGETTSRACLTTTVAWTTVAADTFGLCGLSCCELVSSGRLVFLY